ncbi:GNAT family N-acetyltransferase [Mycobacterium vicinigordonae]|uniref:GNAT family N-acetyltransferase n=1 Tax=Mycobacterium vicinigordonae TaxID=1719132 RepID=A0A7D6DW95_9MYCO|nr:GNAT family N-acetyltransferase [Mycobacterium vicinigordonae]
MRDVTSRIRGHVALHGLPDSPASDRWTAASGIAAEHLLELSRLFVSTAHRRQRLGEALTAEATRYAHGLAVQPVLEVAQQAVAAIRLYERLGWHRVGEWELTIDEQRRLPIFAYLGPAAGAQP